jgi:hypothetical protein
MPPVPVVTDWNNDGRLDLLVGDSTGTLHFYLNSSGNTSGLMADSPISLGGPSLLLDAKPASG